MYIAVKDKTTEVCLTKAQFAHLVSERIHRFTKKANVSTVLRSRRYALFHLLLISYTEKGNQRGVQAMEDR